MRSRELIESFLNYFSRRGHVVRPTAGLRTPQKDLLFTTAGMVPFKELFLGEVQPIPYKRAVSCQKCFRTSDLEKIGKTARHLTYFEMLGNFSFGDYFKKEAIEWAWDFLCNNLQIDKKILWISVYYEDTQAEALWRGLGVCPERIVKRGIEDNFWSMGQIGPCGPCSEVIVDLGIGCGRDSCDINCGCDRYLELWNLVFMEFKREDNGKLMALPQKNIDTGMGLERLCMVMQNKKSLFETDVLWPIVQELCSELNYCYRTDASLDTKINLLADHLRAMTYLIADGVIVSNEAHGYVLRALIRRAVGTLYKFFNIDTPLLYKFIPIVVSLNETLHWRREEIAKLVKAEEERFLGVLERGMRRVQELFARSNGVVEGKEIFKLYDTYGFPLNLLEDLAQQYNIYLDIEGFNVCMQQQRTQSKTRTIKSTTQINNITKTLPQSEFIGYDVYECETKIEAVLYGEGKLADKATSNQTIADTTKKVGIILSKTPFYPVGGGQLSDRGTILTDKAKMNVTEVARHMGSIVHWVDIEYGQVDVGDVALANIDKNYRGGLARAHTATHLLHTTLRYLLGGHISQAGSHVACDTLHFDYTHTSPLTSQQLQRLQEILNEYILSNIDVTTALMPLSEAKLSGAIALFEDAYKDIVRVVRIGDVSLEVCGGTHVDNTSKLCYFLVLREEGVSAGVRRIYAVTGQAAQKIINKHHEIINDLVRLLNANVENLNSAVKNILAQLKDSQKTINLLKEKLLCLTTDKLQAEHINGKKVIVAKLSTDMSGLRFAADRLIQSNYADIVLLASVDQDKALMVMKINLKANIKIVSCDFLKEVAKIIGGGAGGREDFAQAGGPKKENLDKALMCAKNLLRNLLT